MRRARRKMHLSLLYNQETLKIKYHILLPESPRLKKEKKKKKAAAKSNKEWSVCEKPAASEVYFVKVKRYRETRIPPMRAQDCVI